MSPSYSAELRDAFLELQPKLLPGTVWWKGRHPFQLVLDQQSLVLGELAVSFDADEISLHFGPRGHHQHISVNDFPSSDRAAVAREAVQRALVFVKALLADEVVVRWGLFASSTRPRHPRQRSFLPWVREAVWSGYLRD